MIVEFRCDRERARQWMVDTTLPLENQDIGIQIAWAETATPSPAGLDALFELERMVLRKGKSSGADRLKTIPEPRRLGEPDVVVDLTASGRDPGAQPGNFPNVQPGGLPAGSNIEYANRNILADAISGRQKM